MFSNLWYLIIMILILSQNGLSSFHLLVKDDPILSVVVHDASYDLFDGADMVDLVRLYTVYSEI